MSSSSNPLRTSVQDLLHNFVNTQEADGEFVAADILRALQEESRLLYETQCIKDTLDSDPFQCYSKEDAKQRRHLERFAKSLQVTSCFRLEKDDDYCLTEAAVRCHQGEASSVNGSKATSPLHKKQKRQQQQASSDIDPITQLHFRYERTPATETTATSIWYSIDLSQNYGPKENLVTIRVWADGNKPSKLPAVSMDGEEDGWEDIDSDNEEEQEKQKATAEKKSKNGSKNESKEKESEDTPKENGNKNTTNDEKENNNNDEKAEDSADRFACFVDPDVLQNFQEATQLTLLDQATAFFTLMSFPYYQNEWDLVGFVLDSVFGYNEEDDGEDGEEASDEE